MQALAIDADCSDGKKLISQVGVGRDSIDFGDIVYEVMSKRLFSSPTLSVLEVDKYLDMISDHFKQGERSSK